MCSRYSIEAPQGSTLAGLLAKCGFTAASAGEVRPSQRAPVLIDAPQGAAALAMDWGFPAPEGGLVINARSETAAEKPLFRNAVMARRCVLPAAACCPPPLFMSGTAQSGATVFLRPRAIHSTWPACINPSAAGCAL